MPRYKLIVEYDGSRFVGWQSQTNGASVQDALERAVLAFCGERVRVHAAGRTDSGVHALGMAVHFDLERGHAPRKIEGAINFYLLESGIAVISAEEADPYFHARFSATSRSYRYRIVNRRAPLTLDRGRAWHVIPKLDVALMQAGAERLIGHHDFTTFRHSGCQSKSPEKTLDQFQVEAGSGDDIFIHATARSFLHHQVRSMVGTLRLVGEGKWSVDDVSRALEARDRAACGPIAPPDGLYFIAAGYDES